MKEELANILFNEVNSIIKVEFRGAVISNITRGVKVSGRFLVLEDISNEQLEIKFKETNLMLTLPRKGQIINIFKIFRAN